MKPRLEACYFGTGDQGERYERLARVLEHTALEHCRGWTVDVVRLSQEQLEPYRPASGKDSHVWNTWKLEHWVRRILDAPDGAQVLLIDGDTAILRPLDPIWDHGFDIAYTARERNRLPLNGGVVFVRVSDRTRHFMREWLATNMTFLHDNLAHTPWRRAYAGINQSALGYLFEKVDHGCEILKLPCSEWNCVEWDRYAPDRTRVLHVKSGLRRAVFDLPGAGHKPVIVRLVKLWKALERDTQRAAAQVAAG